MTPDVDVLIVGAGISGIGAAYRIRQKNPGLSYAILERRSRIGGTWDLFRYPGIRSDSDIFTLSFPWEPWRRPETVAQGGQIRQYLTDTARKHGIDNHIHFDTAVVSADWDRRTDTWLVTAQRDGAPVNYRCRFVFFATGYYSYDQPYAPPIPGIDDFAGTVVHPQHWPEALDYRDKKVAVIGSGATAISMIPALSEQAGHVTMVQRSPGYVLSQREIDPINNGIRQVLPPRWAHMVVRGWNVLLTMLVYFFARVAPRVTRRYVRKVAVAGLPDGYDVDTHFNPRYDPWDQRLCVSLDGDLYRVISAGRVDVMTDRIDHVDAAGVVLQSGDRVDADIIVTATGLSLQALGGVRLSLGGNAVALHEHWTYRAHLLNDVPNLAWCIGYTNASWTLRADLTARHVANLLAHMRSHGYTHAYPHLGEVRLDERPTFDLQSGYVLRSPQELPRSGTRRPWRVGHNYLADSLNSTFARIDEAMVFGRSPVPVDPVAVLAPGAQ